jgi:hypothetical protein
MNCRAQEPFFLIKLMSLDPCHSKGDGGTL